MGLTLGLSNTRLASRSYRSGFFPCDHAGALQAKASNAPQTHRHTPGVVRRLRFAEVFAALAPWCSWRRSRLPWAALTFIADGACSGLLASLQPAVSSTSTRPATGRAVASMVRFMAFPPVSGLRLVE